jgi:hypothetical protein
MHSVVLVSLRSLVTTPSDSIAQPLGIMEGTNRFVLLDGSRDEIARISELIDGVMVCHSDTSELYLKDLCLDDENDEGLGVALRSMFRNRTKEWEEISTDNCKGSVADLLSFILEVSTAAVLLLLLDSVVIDKKVSSMLQRSLSRPDQALNKLQICDSELTYIFAAPILRALVESTSTVETLVFSHCSFDQSAVVGLANSLQKCRSIKSLDLSSCELSDKNIALLMRPLKGGHPNPTLEHLDIRKNECATEAILAIEELLQATNVLKTMKVTLPHDAEIPLLNITRKRRRVSKNRTLQLQFTRRDPLNDKGVEFSCSVSYQLKV